jgi:predicted CopG family antitoxin
MFWWMADTTIPIDSDVRDELRAEKKGGETYSEVIERLLSEDK